MNYDFEKTLSLFAVGISLALAFTILINLQPNEAISTKVISDSGISYYNNSYYIKYKTKLDKVSAKNFFKKSTSNKNLENKIRLTTTKGKIVPVSNLTVTQYVYHD